MRRSVVFGAAAILVACASASPPPGGPEDKAPPRVISVTPDTNALNVHPDHVSFYFDEVINDRGSGEQEIDKYFLLSPSAGQPNVSWHRSRIDVKPRGGFQPNIAYSVTLLPGLSDLHNNRMKDGTTVQFSTGSSIPPHRISGIVFDWIAERPAAQAFVEAIIPGPDSVRYLAQTDSLGKFSLGPMGQGSFLVRAIIDQNGNRGLDRNEAFDTARVSTPLANTLELLATLRDTLPAHVLTVSLTDSVTLSVTFDRALDPTSTVAVSQFKLAGADSAAITIRSAMTPRQVRVADSLALKIADDSARKADSLAGKPRPTPPAAAPVTPVPGAKPPPPPPKPSLPPPFTSFTLKLERPLAPNSTYRLGVANIKGLSGRVVSSERTFTTPKPPPPKPTTDSTRARPAAATPPPAKPPQT